MNSEPTSEAEVADLLGAAAQGHPIERLVGPKIGTCPSPVSLGWAAARGFDTTDEVEHVLSCVRCASRLARLWADEHLGDQALARVADQSDPHAALSFLHVDDCDRCRQRQETIRASAGTPLAEQARPLDDWDFALFVELLEVGVSRSASDGATRQSLTAATGDNVVVGLTLEQGAWRLTLGGATTQTRVHVRWSDGTVTTTEVEARVARRPRALETPAPGVRPVSVYVTEDVPDTGRVATGPASWFASAGRLTFVTAAAHAASSAHERLLGTYRDDSLDVTVEGWRTRRGIEVRIAAGPQAAESMLALRIRGLQERVLVVPLPSSAVTATVGLADETDLDVAGLGSADIAWVTGDAAASDLIERSVRVSDGATQETWRAVALRPGVGPHVRAAVAAGLR